MYFILPLMEPDTQANSIICFTVNLELLKKDD